MIRSLALALMLAVSACAEQQAAPQPTPPPVVQLNRTQWISTEGGLNAPTLEFIDSRANGHTGCNRFFAQVELNGPSIRFGGISTTRRACSPDLMELEQNFVSRLEGARFVRVDADALVLLDVNNVEIARFGRRGRE
ncbi:MAG TPA: META domain-containing protein [Vitreimonas sp.]|uniref:META domain-containing protein n=1 Tax=Vitreimonas sp. TaxID=3069702 RepID=UPI002D34C6DA|nr:META domain-containing protein [Vitreimonas sp.]HYD88043.1 META domain-containing protein [Vitreimonas sp.]